MNATEKYSRLDSGAFLPQLRLWGFKGSRVLQPNVNSGFAVVGFLFLCKASPKFGPRGICKVPSEYLLIRFVMEVIKEPSTNP